MNNNKLSVGDNIVITTLKEDGSREKDQGKIVEVNGQKATIEYLVNGQPIRETIFSDTLTGVLPR